VLLLGWHVLGSHFYLNTRFKLALGVLCGLIPVGFFLRGPLRGHTRWRRAPGLRVGASTASAVSYGAVALLLVALLLLALFRLAE
jgi:hypothetical protein